MTRAPADIEYLDLEDLLALTRALGAGPVRDVGLLDAACSRPGSSVFGADAYPSLEAKAAALLHSLARYHALVDGNEPLAWLAAVVFLDINGYTVDLDDEAALQLVMAVSTGDLEVDDLAERFATDRPSTRRRLRQRRRWVPHDVPCAAWIGGGLPRIRPARATRSRPRPSVVA
ncbi:type II toxin-antitoxin system death-on-curing family toxin [Nitriliruptor alkaliphilus]|uniref:type II toxin-antitoxin system death-on-curing family toxin n=1 Tax=Nitriliruptor alkaliphilus TaxID=427918 RepID=UPI0009F93140|nr:Fic family protein [Nitriliruptor alkaliphilus]